MRTALSRILALGFVCPAFAGLEPPKTNSSAKVDQALIAENPFIFNGMVLSDESQGSGVVVENTKLFLTAAHVLYDPINGWSQPPFWIGGGLNAGLPPEMTTGSSRGYFRWTQYSAIVTAQAQNSPKAFNKDVALVWGLEPFFNGEPARLDFKGSTTLRKHNLSMITGFPASLDYTDESGDGVLHSTAPDYTPFRASVDRYLYATHISTGPGNSGGPVWSQSEDESWKVSGILVAGRPSEAGVYGITTATRTLLKATAPLIGTPRKSSKNVAGVSTGTARMVMPKPRKIPDGLHRWTKIPFKFNQFAEDATVTRASIDLTVTTGHVGDLLVLLVGPDGAYSLIHDGEGAGEDDLVIDDRDLSADFPDSEAKGTWSLMVQDRLTGDPSVVTRCEVEIGVE